MLRILQQLTLLVLVFMGELLCAQEVQISREINVRNDYAYDLLNIADQCYFYRDKGYEYYFDLFDKDLNFRRTIQIEVGEKKSFIESIHTIDSTLNLYYSYKKNGLYFIKAKKYDKDLNLLDTLSILESEIAITAGEFRTVLSEDKSKLLMFNFEKKNLTLILIDTKNFELISSYDVINHNFRMTEDFEEIAIANNADVFILFEKNNSSWDKEKHAIGLTSLINGQLFTTDISAANTINSGVKMQYDNVNRSVKIAGLWSSKSEVETEGFFAHILSYNELAQNSEIELQKQLYDENILRDLNGLVNKTKNNILNDFFLREVLNRNDGGIVLIAELQREYSRRNGMPNFDRAFADRSFAGRSYIDYYCEDLIIISVDPSGKQTWRKILFKKQYSQDDEGIYSSFFILKVPSQMHIIFNDEIKNANTVSEYVIDPLGNFKRNSLLSTEYKNLRLRFKDGVQISSNSFVVPSEKNGKVNLVKIAL